MMKKEDAEEFTQSLGQIVGGSWRQVALAKRLGVPEALGLSVEQWVTSRLGGYVRMNVEDRRNAVVEMKAEGASNREVAAVLGVDEGTIRGDLRAENSAPTPTNTPIGAENSAPLDAIGALAVTEQAQDKERREERKAERIADIERQRDDIAKGSAAFPDGLFNVISIDPPWPYGTEYDPNGRRAANPYPEMSLPEIAAIPIPAATDCVLWLWTTHKFMRDAFVLVDRWGFREVAILTWVKDRIGLGSWLRSQSEFCVMAVRGAPPIRLTNQSTVISGPLREHSRKPDEFYAMVNELCVGRKLDYFSREARDGWEQVGNDRERFAA